jgi:hypothetical protein
MRARIARLVLCFAVLVAGSQASAAPVDVTLTRVAASNDWRLGVSVNGTLSLGGMALRVSSNLVSFSSTDFEISQGSFLDQYPYDGIHGVLYVFPIDYVPLVTGPVQNFTLGTLHASNASLPELLDAEADVGFTVIDFPNYSNLPPSAFSISVTPEPAPLLLGAIVAMSLIGGRRRVSSRFLDLRFRGRVA